MFQNSIFIAVIYLKNTKFLNSSKLKLESETIAYEYLNEKDIFNNGNNNIH